MDLGKLGGKIWVVVLLGGIAVLFVIVAAIFGLLNKEAELRTNVEAQQIVLKNYVDVSYKTIAQAAQIPDKAKSDVKELIGALIEGRSTKDQAGGMILKAIREDNPKYDTKLYEKLMDLVEAKRSDYNTQQTKLVDMNREHNVMFERQPSGFFLGIFGRQRTKITVVSSAHTDEIFNNGGQENDIELFPGKP